MSYKSLLTVLLTSLSSLGAIAPITNAQERPECYLIDTSGELTDLSDICDVSQQRSPDTETATDEAPNIVNNNNNIIGFDPLATRLPLDDSAYVLGEDNFSVGSAIDSTYYIDNEIGMDYTAYIRRYQTAPTSITRQTLKEQVFQFDAYPNSLTSILRQSHSRIPFIIYRYQI